MTFRTLAPYVAAALVLGACSDRPTGPAASDDAELRSTHTNSFGPLVLPATGTLADGGSFVGEVEIRRIDIDHATGNFIIHGMLQGKGKPARLPGAVGSHLADSRRDQPDSRWAWRRVTVAGGRRNARNSAFRLPLHRASAAQMRSSS